MTSAFIPDTPTDTLDFFRPAPLPLVLIPDGPDEGCLVLPADAPWLGLDEMDALTDDELQTRALSPLDLVVGGIATADSMLGRGLLADARNRFNGNGTRDEHGVMVIGLMYLESGAGLDRRTYHPQDLILQSGTERRPGIWWRPWCLDRMPGVPDHWLQL